MKISRREYEEYWERELETKREYGYLWIDGKKTHVVLSPIPEKLKKMPGYEEYNWVVEILEYRPDAQYYRYFKEKPKLEHSSNPDKNKDVTFCVKKFPAPPRVRIPIKEEVKCVIERKVEPGLARFGVYKPEQPPLDAYLNFIEKAKQVALEKKKLEGK